MKSWRLLAVRIAVQCLHILWLEYFVYLVMPYLPFLAPKPKAIWWFQMVNFRDVNQVPGTRVLKKNPATGKIVTWTNSRITNQTDIRS